MNPIFKNILGTFAAILLGSMVNMGLIMVSGSIIPPPEGVDPSNMESLKAGMHLFQPQHFIFPFLAHALGTFVGALIIFLIAHSKKQIFAYAIGVFFFAGGLANILMLPSPLWFTLVDLILAYIPMSFLAILIGKRIL